MSGRRDDGYRVRYRLASPRARGGKLATVAAGIVVAAWLAATLTAPPRPPEILRVDPTAPIGSDAHASIGIGPTFPPSVERFIQMGDLSIPLLSDHGPSWLETREGVLRTADSGCGTEWLFMWADGSTLCVSGLPPGEVHRQARTYSPVGELISTVQLTGRPAGPGQRIVSYVELDSANGLLYAASARVGPDDQWAIWLDRWSIDAGTHDAARIAAGRDGAIVGRSVDVTLWLSPDARHARLRFAVGLDPFQPATEPFKAWTWNVPISGEAPGDAVLVGKPEGRDRTFCFAEGWATSDVFVAGCVTAGDGDADRLVVHSSTLDGGAGRVDLGPVNEQPAWILSGTSGRLFLWAPQAHMLWRVDVPSLDVHRVGELSPDDYLDVPADTPWPATGDDMVAWEPRGLRWMPFSVERRPIVGAHDGTVVYTAGLWPVARRPGAFESSGIWAFDASSLTILARWDAVGTYRSLAMTPGGDYVIALGNSTSDEMAAFGNIGSTMAFHDARAGTISLILRQRRSVIGLLDPEPYPEPT